MSEAALSFAEQLDVSSKSQAGTADDDQYSSDSMSDEDILREALFGDAAPQKPSPDGNAQLVSATENAAEEKDPSAPPGAETGANVAVVGNCAGKSSPVVVAQSTLEGKMSSPLTTSPRGTVLAGKEDPKPGSSRMKARRGGSRKEDPLVSTSRKQDMVHIPSPVRTASEQRQQDEDSRRQQRLERERKKEEEEKARQSTPVDVSKLEERVSKVFCLLLGHPCPHGRGGHRTVVCVHTWSLCHYMCPVSCSWSLCYSVCPVAYQVACVICQRGEEVWLPAFQVSPKSIPPLFSLLWQTPSPNTLCPSALGGCLCLAWMHSLLPEASLPLYTLFGSVTTCDIAAQGR